MTLLARVFREPLVHFLLIGGAVFALYMVFDTDTEEEVRDKIVVTEGRVQQLAQVFAKTWQRPPYPRELRGLIDAYIKEEVYYREAIKLGLDRDDTLIRRRMQQKMEFLSEPDEEELNADDAALQAFLENNRGPYRVEPQIAFEQVYFNPKAGMAVAKRRADEALAALKSGDSPDALGDPTLLPASKPLSPLRNITRDFGDEFTETLTALPPGAWTGPVNSAFGVHLVRITEVKDGYDPDLADIRDEVLRDWRTLRREAHERQAYETLLAKYEIVLPAPEDDVSQEGDAP